MRVRIDIPQKVLKALDAQVRDNLRPVLVQLGEEMVEHAKELTRERLVNDRPEHRRNASRGLHHYLDSFAVGAPDTSGGRARILIRNSHPGAKPIEEGTEEHEIEGPGSFPFASTRLGGRDYAAAGNRFTNVKYGGNRNSVDHPGTPAQNIVADTKEWARANIRDVTVRIALTAKR